MNPPQISIIVPVYNGEKFLVRCVESVCRQSFADWELVMVDDGSTDGSRKLIEALAEKDDRIKPIYKVNEGVVKAREAGVDRSCGQAIMFLDCDDYLTADALSLAYGKMVADDSDLVIASYSLHWSHTGYINAVLNPKPKEATPEAALDYCLRYGETFLPIKLFRRELFRQSVAIPPQIAFMEDTVGILQYLAAASSVSYVQESIYYYFKHPQSACYNSSEKHWHSERAVFDFVARYRQTAFGLKCDKTLSRLMIKLAYDLIGHSTTAEYRTIAAELAKLDKTKPGVKRLICITHINHPRLSRMIDTAYRQTLQSGNIIKDVARKLLRRQ